MIRSTDVVHPDEIAKGQGKFVMQIFGVGYQKDTNGYTFYVRLDEAFTRVLVIVLNPSENGWIEEMIKSMGESHYPGQGIEFMRRIIPQLPTDFLVEPAIREIIVWLRENK